MFDFVSGILFLVFENLYHLTISPNDVGTCLKFLPFLLKKNPNLNLETLIINVWPKPQNFHWKMQNLDFHFIIVSLVQGPLHYDEEKPESVCKCMSGYTFLLSCPLKVLQITEYHGTTGEVEQLKHFLGKLPCLKSVKLHSWERLYSNKKILLLPIAPPKCKIKVTFWSS